VKWHRRLALLTLWLALGFVVAWWPDAQPATDSVAPQIVPIGALPTAGPRAPIVVLTDEPGIAVVDPRLFLLVTVSNRENNPVAAQISVEYAETGEVVHYESRATQLLNLSALKQSFVIRVVAPGYQSVEQAFEVDMHTDTDYVLTAVLEAFED
jgi:hypothetical protein